MKRPEKKEALHPDPKVAGAIKAARGEMLRNLSGRVQSFPTKLAKRFMQGEPANIRAIWKSTFIKENRREAVSTTASP
jgi:hypothetical protein